MAESSTLPPINVGNIQKPHPLQNGASLLDNSKQQAGTSTLLTQTGIVETGNKKYNEIFSYEEVPAAVIIETKDFTPMNKYFNIHTGRVRNNIMNTLHFLNTKTKDVDKEQRFLDWRKRLELSENENIITDGFWLILLRKNINQYKDKARKIKEIEGILLDRIAVNYVGLMERAFGIDKALFFQIYFDIISQGVFYSFFYAFPKSREVFNDSFKRFIFDTFTQLFTGINISPKSKFIKGSDYEFISHWCLDLGAGDVLKSSSIHFVAPTTS